MYFLEQAEEASRGKEHVMLRKEKREPQERGGGKNGEPRYWQPSTGKATGAEGSRPGPGELSPSPLDRVSLVYP